MRPASLHDERLMRQALREAEKAYVLGEIPIGAVVAFTGTGQIIGRGHNLTEQLRDVTAHAEMLALTAAANHLGNKYLHECTLYVTVEPCVMCAGAAAWAQLPRVVYGTLEPKVGYSRHGQLLHPRCQVITGVLAEECALLMRQFFASKRK